MRTEMVTVTPAIARNILLQNTGNRKIRKSVVTKYARDMREGRWMLSHQGIAIDNNGNLIDGQHRLMAVIESGTNIVSLVSTGMQPESFEIIDKLSARSDADSLRMEQRYVEVFKMIATIVSTRPSMALTKNCISAFDYSYKSIGFSNTVCKLFTSSSVRAAAVLAAYEKPENTQKISMLYHSMISGTAHEISLSASSLMRSVYNGTIKSEGGSTGRIMLLQKFFTLFCMDNDELTKIYPTRIDRIESIINKAIGESK